jgi:hypothetical protein
MKSFIRKVVSGGQTGADRAGLEAAKELGIETGGYCPKNHRTEDGCDLSLKGFGLIQTETEGYDERTALNVRHSDGTVIFSKTDKAGNVIGAGTVLTVKMLNDMDKPFVINPQSEEFSAWVIKNNIRVLNVAGNRKSQNRNVYNNVFKFLKENLMIDSTDTDSNEYKKFENYINEIKNDKLSGSGTLVINLVNAMFDYVMNSNAHSSVIHYVITLRIY